MSTALVIVFTGSFGFFPLSAGAADGAVAAGGALSGFGVSTLLSMLMPSKNGPSGKDFWFLRQVDARFSRLSRGIDDPAATHRLVDIDHREVRVAHGDGVVEFGGEQSALRVEYFDVARVTVV